MSDIREAFESEYNRLHGTSFSVMRKLRKPDGYADRDERLDYAYKLWVSAWFSNIYGTTHYAVVDEYGEIVYSRRICATIDAEAQCKHYIKLCDKDPVTRSHMNNWTIKGVTVNED